jgi:hypothetical protein
MSYATDDQIELAAGGADRLVALADWNGDGTADAEVLARAKEASDGLIDGNLRLKLGAADLARVRATPTPTLSAIAAAEAVYWMRQARSMVGPEDVEHRKERERQLAAMNAGTFRIDDEPEAQRAVFIENDGEVTRKNTRGMW